MRIDGRELVPEPGATILETAERAGIRIPRLCAIDGMEPFNSCMVCLVELGNGELVPACSYPAGGTVDVSTGGSRVTEARRRALELLLTEHRGDCEGPCTRSCPAGLDIPGMIGLIGAGDIRGALALARSGVVLPGVMGRICAAPCERACRRRLHDLPVSIRLLEGFAAAFGGGAETEPVLQTGMSVAIIGAGPAGLSAAAAAARAGFPTVVFDANDLPGGALRYAVSREELPEEVLDTDIEGVRDLGVLFEQNRRVGSDLSVEELAADFGAVVVTAPVPGSEGGEGNPSVVYADRVAPAAAGSAVRAVARGRDAALAAFGPAAGGPRKGRRFDSRYGRFSEEELARFVSTSGAETEKREAAGPVSTPEEARSEARRCLRCDCAAKDDCALRRYAGEYGADIGRFRGIERVPFARTSGSARIVYEEGKCIRCGVCVRIAESRGVTPGFGFAGRGYGVRVRPPFGEDPVEALGAAADLCVRSCPTGALSFGRGGQT